MCRLFAVLGHQHQDVHYGGEDDGRMITMSMMGQDDDGDDVVGGYVA